MLSLGGDNPPLRTTSGSSPLPLGAATLVQPGERGFYSQPCGSSLLPARSAGGQSHKHRATETAQL